MMRLGGSADVGAAGHLVHFLKADIFQGALDLGEGNVLPELPHDGGRHLRHDIVALFNRPDQLKICDLSAMAPNGQLTIH